MAISPVEAKELAPEAIVTPVHTRVENGQTVVYPVGMKTIDGKDVGAQMLTSTIEELK